MKEIGGYLEFEQFSFPMLHEGALALNSGSRCLSYLIRARRIKKLVIPSFMCDCVENVCKYENIDYRFYSITETFMPSSDLQLNADEWLYLVNFYGQLSYDMVKSIVNQYHRVIVDQVHSYFEKRIGGIDTIYSCRKYFGVPDGAFLYTEAELVESLEQDQSYDKLYFLGGRLECSASEFYLKFIENEDKLSRSSIKRMSRVTLSILHGIDYQRIYKIRTNNYKYLDEHLGAINLLTTHPGTYMYPLLVRNGAYIRQKLIDQKIYIPVLWPNVLRNMPNDSLEYRYANDILPLPIDQRYGGEEMKYICETIMSYVKG